MAIKYKKIITEIMGEEATKRGFKIERGRNLLATRALAYFVRNTNGRNQMFEITEYTIYPGRIFLRGAGKEDYTLNYSSEEEFIDCIHKFDEYMMEKGYDLLDSLLSQAEPFTKEDSAYLVDNYSDMSKRFFEKYNVDRNASMESLINCFISATESQFDKSWDEAKDEILLITAAIIETMVSRYDASIEGEDKFIYFDLERKKDGRNIRLSALKLVRASYRTQNVKELLARFLWDFVD